MKLLKLLGSIQFAIFLIAALAVILATSTLMESVHGTPFAQKVFYRAGWFDLFLGLLWINIFCSTLTRFPFKKHHTGFVVTHIGILTLLIGALLARLFGIEGQVTLFEGEHKNHLIQEGYVLNISSGNQEPITVDLKSKNRTGPIFSDPFSLVISRTWERAVAMPTVSEGSSQDPMNHAIQVTLASNTVALNETFWLIENDPENPHSSLTAIGPALIELKTKKEQEPTEPKLILYQKEGEILFSLPLTQEMLARWQNPSLEKISIPNTDLVLSHFRYLPNAKVKNNELVNDPEEIRFNPAIEFEVSNSKGRREHHTKFALFPHFDSLHGKIGKNYFHLTVLLEMPMPPAFRESSSPSLTFYVSSHGRPTYRSVSSKGALEGDIQLHEPISAGWMDITFTVHQILERAVLSKQIVENPKAGEYAVELSLAQENLPEQKQWVLTDQPVTFQTKQGPVELLLTPKKAPLPFLLQLVDFRKIDYPGSQMAAAYESDVVLFDLQEKTTLQKTIRMNKPLVYNGFKIFQASYIQDPSLGEASVFSIAKNPGISSIYSGAVILFTGVLVLFYVKPFSRESARDGD